MTDETDKKDKEAAEKEASEKAAKAAAEEKGGAKSENEGLLKSAVTAAERLEAANKVTTENLDRQEQLQAESVLGGKADAGAGNKEDTPEEYAKKVMANEIETKDD